MSTVPTPAELDLRVRRLENDAGSIYEILGQMQTNNEARFDGIDGRLDAQGAQLSEILELLRASGSQ